MRVGYELLDSGLGAECSSQIPRPGFRDVFSAAQRTSRGKIGIARSPTPDECPNIFAHYIRVREQD